MEKCIGERKREREWERSERERKVSSDTLSSEYQRHKERENSDPLEHWGQKVKESERSKYRESLE